jgi:hypothetical protein
MGHTLHFFLMYVSGALARRFLCQILLKKVKKGT